MKIIRSSLDLGYNTIETNRKILNLLPNIFFALILSQNYASSQILDPNLDFEVNFGNFNKVI